jgi:hypothetical protein
LELLALRVVSKRFNQREHWGHGETRFYKDAKSAKISKRHPVYLKPMTAKMITTEG